jgi:protease-4
MRTIGKFFVGLFATVGFIVILLIGLTIYGVSHMDTKRDVKPAPDRFVLTLDFDKGFEEAPEGKGLAAFKFSSHIAFQDAVVALRRAKDDPRVLAIAARINDKRIGMARTQELRDLIAQFRSTGKPAAVFSESIGEGTGALSAYYLASAFGEMWVQPSGTVGVAGIGVEAPFAKKLLERMGLKMSVIKRKEYKSAAETLTEEAMSPAAREESEALVNGWYGQMIAGIAADRKLSADAVKALVDKGPLTAQEAKEGGLIDHLGYRDEFDAELTKLAKTDAHVPLSKYAVMAPPAGLPAPTKTIAVISAVGEIARSSDDNPLTSDVGIKSAVTSKAIREAVANKDVNAIILRIDSPGGSYVGSDTIWREVIRAKDSKKPVIVSMGDVAASGGYFIAMPADYIFADAGTVTGSIGVLAGKMVIGGASDKLDIHWDRISAGESAGLFSSTRDFTPKELERMNQVLDVVYADFTGKAAEGRKLDPEKMEKAARGRVWNGTDALTNGLIDEIGGFSQAIDYTKKKLGLSATDTVTMLAYPKQQDPWEKIFKALSDDDVPDSILSAMRVLVQVGHVTAPLQGILSETEARGPQLRIAPVEAE